MSLCGSSRKTAPSRLPPAKCCDGEGVGGGWLPIAATVANAGAPFVALDFLVTRHFSAGTAFALHFYPSTAGYTAQSGSTVMVVTSAALYPGGFVRYLYTVDDGVRVLARPSGTTTWQIVAVALSPPSMSDAGNVLVSWCPAYGALQGMCFLGLAEGAVPPPPSVVPLQFQIIVPSGPDTSYVLAFMHRTGIPGRWLNAWQLLKWGNLVPTWDAAIIPAADNYTVAVDGVEAQLFIAPNPGALIALGYKPYDSDVAPGFSGMLVLVATTLIPASTSVDIVVNEWYEPSPTSSAPIVPNYVWSTDVDIPAGTVISWVGFGGIGALRATHGRLIAGGDPVAGDTTVINAFTLFTSEQVSSAGDTRTVVYPITGVYPGAYTAMFPAGLVPGVSMLATPWPDCGSIIQPGGCGPTPRVCNWACEALALSNACPVRWTCQFVPSFPECCSKCGCSGGGGGCGCSNGGALLLGAPAGLGPSAVLKTGGPCCATSCTSYVTPNFPVRRVV